MSQILGPLVLLLMAQGEAPQDPLSALEAALTTAIAKAERSVVAITRSRNSDPNITTAIRGRTPAPAVGFRSLDDDSNLSDPNFLPMPGDFGSGVVIGKTGEILTAFHVVRGSSRIFVRAPGQIGFDAEIIAADPRSDLAVIAPRAIPGEPPPALTPIPIGQADKMKKGAFLVVLGNPFNTARDGKASASWGILSNTTRRILPPREDRPEAVKVIAQAFQHQPTLWQLDAKLNLGMSGAAVVNLKGDLVGITTTGGNAEGFDAQAGYAIPLDALGRRVVEALVQGQEAEYGFLGIKLAEPGSNRIGPMGVIPGTPAAEGDLLVNDEIIAVGDRPVLEAEGGLTVALSTARVGERVKLKVRRNGQILEKSVLVAKYPIAGEVIASNRPAPWRGLRVDYTSVLVGSSSSDSPLAEMAKGLVSITDVQTGSPAEQAGLRRGQIITRVGDQPVRTPAEFVRAVAAVKGPVTLQTDRGVVVVK